MAQNEKRLKICLKMSKPGDVDCYVGIIQLSTALKT